jgi:type II secretory pathway pseudopilin PulG
MVWKFNKNLSNKSGFERKLGMTLVEVVVAMGLVSLLTLAMTSMLTRGLAAYRSGQQTITSQERAARVMREFEYSARAATEIITANPSELAFYRFYDGTAAYPKKVRYFIDGNSFKVGKTEPQGTAPNITYPADAETIDFLVEDLTNTTTIFTYYNGNDEALSAPVTLSDIRMLMLAITIDSIGSKPPGPISESTKVNLRNKKTNL